MRLFSRAVLFCFLFLFLVVVVVAHSHAAPESRSRFAAYLGAGAAGSDSADGRNTIEEGPFSYAFSFDFAWRSNILLLGEHMRSFADGASSIGLTGMGIKIYPWLSPMDARGAYSTVANRSLISVAGYSYYYGGGAGLAQSSVPPIGRRAANVAVGEYLSFKSGVEFGLGRDWGMRLEFNYAMTVAGSGSISMMNLSLGLSYAL